MPGQRAGSIISATFGLIYVLVNSWPLPTAWTWLLRAAAVIAFVGILIVLFRGRGVVPSGPAVPGGASPFGRSYWVIVAAEVVALFGGLRLLSGPLDHPQGAVAWVSLVVGLHFFALAVVFHAPFFHWLGAAVTVCGAIGLVLAFAGAAQSWISVIGGIIPGALLLGFGWWAATSIRTAVDS